MDRSYQEWVKFLAEDPARVAEPLWTTNSVNERKARVALRERVEFRRWLRAHPNASPKSFRPESSERVISLAEQDDRED